jgi:2-amino-4-hydroxy-6-hydroxymethyldihydropteridine diphosphokinase
MASVYVGLGSNLGDRAGLLNQALTELAELGEVDAVSSVYATEPWGDTDQPGFLNLCCRLLTELAPQALLRQTQAIEQRLGRRPSRRWGPRLIDIDLLTYDDLQLDTAELTLPHPHLTERSFVLVPLIELAPTLHIPGQFGSVTDLLTRLENTGQPPRKVDGLTLEPRRAPAPRPAASPPAT